MTRLPPPKKHAQSSLTSLKIYYRASITVEKQEQKKLDFWSSPGTRVQAKALSQSQLIFILDLSVNTQIIQKLLCARPLSWWSKLFVPRNLGTASQEKVLMGMVDIKKTNLEVRGLLEIGWRGEKNNVKRRQGQKGREPKGILRNHKQSIYGGKNPFLNRKSWVRRRPLFLPKKQGPSSNSFLPGPERNPTHPRTACSPCLITEVRWKTKSISLSCSQTF